MNEETNQLIRELADKLGTTAEHLWGVLIMQAPISSATNILLLVVSIVMTSFATILMIKGWMLADDCDEEKGVPIFIVGMLIALIFGITAVSLLVHLDTIVAGFINPEYWALKQIMK